MWTFSLLFLFYGANASMGAENMFNLATDDTRLSVGIVGRQLAVGHLSAVSGNHAWLGDPVSIPLMAKVWVGEKEMPAQWLFENASRDDAMHTVTFCFSNATPRLELRSIWRARPGRGPIEHWIEIENKSDNRVTLGHQDSLFLPTLHAPNDAALWWIKRGGGNASTQGGTFTEPLSTKTDLSLASNCDDGASPSPWLAVQAGDSCGLHVGWEFSGLGRIHAKAVEGGLSIAVGNMPAFKTDIGPGEAFLVPPAFVGCYAGDIDDGAYALHQWILRYLRPPLAEDIPDPILAYNLYLDAGGPSAKEADVLRSAAFCRDLGFEAFMPDAMWFPECGDWRWDPARFPNGVAPIEAFVHENGMRLALWCAWTNGGIAEDSGALSVRGSAAHPDWFDADFASDWKPGPFYGGRICLASPDAKEWAIRKTQWLAGNHKLDYLKHDCGPIVNACNKTTHRHHYGVDASYWATTGYYEVQEKLRKAYPRIILENCSGGGHIKDFGIIQRTHYTVTTDTLSNLPDRQSIYDSTFAFPPLLLQAYTYEREYKVPGDDPGSFLWRSAMMGAWQIDPTNTKIWTDDDRECAKRNVQIYKEWIRPMLKDVKVHHILPRPDGKHWDGMFLWSASLKRGTLYIFRPDAEENAKTVALKGLDPAKSYWVWSEDGSVPAAERKGADLMQAGVAVALPQRYTCDLVYVQDAELGKPAGLDAPGAFKLGGVEVSSDAFTVSAKAAWNPSANARSYRVSLSDTSDFATTLANKTVSASSVEFMKLPPERKLYWKVQAIAWGGATWNEDGVGDFKTPQLKPLSGVTFVSDMEWTRSTAGADNTVHRDTNYHGKEISIAGHTYPKGIWTHSFPDATPADTVINIAGKGFVRFEADAGVEDSAGGGSVQFQVFVGGFPKSQSPVMRSGSARHFHIDVTGAKEITLRVLNGGDGFQCDHAAWGFARFIHADASDPLALRPVL